jgi:hypothetical protein
MSFFRSHFRQALASGHCPAAGHFFIQPGGRIASIRSWPGDKFDLRKRQFQKGIPRFFAFCQSIGSMLSRRLSGLLSGGQVARRLRVLCQLVSATIRPGKDLCTFDESLIAQGESKSACFPLIDLKPAFS